MRSTRLAWMLVGGLTLAGLSAATPASADTVLLTDGSMLTGEVQGPELSVAHRDGTSKVALRDVQVVLLNTLGGDVLVDGKGRVTTGLVEQSSFAVRLPSGQTVVVPRPFLSRIHLTAR